jgi:hypothetical protein
MYLAKFFHRSPGDDDRELLFIPGDEPMILGIHMAADVRSSGRISCARNFPTSSRLSRPTEATCAS